MRKIFGNVEGTLLKNLVLEQIEKEKEKGASEDLIRALENTIEKIEKNKEK